MIQYLLTHSPLLYFTQSLWRDEAFSILLAERSIRTFFTTLSFDPPLYYILLHFWMKIFGQSEIATRSLSLAGFSLATYIVIVWSEKLFKKSWLSWYLPVFFFINPMLIYYAFEARAYGWYVCFATLAMYAYTQKKWQLLGIATVCGFYTHSYFIFVPFIQLIHYLLYNRRQLFTTIQFKRFITDSMIRTICISAIFMLPWLVFMITVASKLKNSWYFPVDLHLIKSVLGNMFLGYEGTPWYMWGFTTLLSIVLIVLFIYAIINSKHTKECMYFLLAVFVPLSIIIGISFIKPLFVNRYLIPVTIAEIFLVVLALDAIKNKIIQTCVGGGILIATLLFNMWYPSQHVKFPYRSVMEEVNALRGPHDVLFTTSSLNFFETIYYAKNRSGVYLYNPSGSSFPWYVGDVIVSNTQMAYDYPVYPLRAIVVTPEGKIRIQYRTIKEEQVNKNPAKKGPGQ